MSSKRDVSDELNERHRKVLARLLKEEGNKSCADCRMRNPTWASVNLGVFVCLTCSGIHRSLGVHISQVRSTNLDTWLPRQVEYIACMGNVKANKYWEAQLPPEFRRPSGVSPNAELQAFIRNKYCEKRYVARDVAAPSIDNYKEHPFVIADPAPAAAADEPQQAPRPPIVTPRQPAPAIHTISPALQPAPVRPVPPPAVDLLGMDDPPAPAPVPAAAAAPVVAAAAPVAAAATPATADPFAVLSAPTASSPASDWSDFSAAPPTSQPPGPAAPAPPADPFAAFIATDLIPKAADLALGSKPGAAAAPHHAPPAKPNHPQVSPEDILKLYETNNSGNAFSDNFFSSATSPPPAPVHPTPPGQLPAHQFSAQPAPGKLPHQPPHQPGPYGFAPQQYGGPAIPAYGSGPNPHAGLGSPTWQPNSQPTGGFQPGPGTGGVFMGGPQLGGPQLGGLGGLLQHPQQHLHQPLGGSKPAGGAGGAGANHQQAAGLLNNQAAFAGLVDLQAPGFGKR